MAIPPSSPEPAFVTTHWTRVLAARGQSTDARAALSELCAEYYQPVVAFLRATLRDEDRAREVAHEFFRELLSRDSMADVDPRRGRFRSYLLGAVKHFVANQRDRDCALKRGAGAEHVPLEPGSDTSPGIDPPAPEALSPEVAFDRQWALTILERALASLEAEHQAPDRAMQFAVLRPWLTNPTTSQAGAAARLGMNEGAVKVAIHRLRRRFRELVKGEIARTLGDGSQLPEELNYLVTVLAA